MNEPVVPQKEKDHGTEVIIATTLVVMTCILSCATVLVILVLRIPH